MIDISVKELLEVTNGSLLQGDSSIMVNSISIDSRQLKKGDFFIPIVGEKFDGHSYIDSSINSGAIGSLIDRDMNLEKYSNDNLLFIKVSNTTSSLQSIAKLVLKKLSIPVVAVTGSTGKTTTKELIYTILSKKYCTLKNQGNFNNHIGLPLTLFKLLPKHEIAVLEMGMSGKGEIDCLCNIAQPQVGVITNIGISHIEKLGSQEDIFKAKMEITDYMSKNNQLIVNGDDKYLENIEKLKDKNRKYTTTFVGTKIDNDIYATKLMIDEKKIKFQVNINNKLYDFILNVPGEHNVINSLLAIAVGLYFEIPINMIQLAISEFRGNKMRLCVLEIDDNVKVINDCYNASPDSMLSALKVLKQTNANRRIAVIGDMLEMGSYSIKAHKSIGKLLKSHNVDILITVGNDSKYIGVGAEEDGFELDKIYNCETNRDVLYLLNNFLKSYDALLIKGSRGMKMEEIVQSLQERS